MYNLSQYGVNLHEYLTSLMAVGCNAGGKAGVHDTSNMSSDSNVLHTNFWASLALGAHNADLGTVESNTSFGWSW